MTKFAWITGMALGLMLTAGILACDQKQAEQTAAPAAGGAITWMGYDEGMAMAREAGKPVMVDFYTTWCKYCKMLDDTTYKDAEIVGILNEYFVCIKVDAEGSDTVTDKGKQMTKAELAKAYNVTGYPTIWFFDDKGEPVGPLPGYSGPEEFKPVLTFLTSGAYSRGVKYQDYINSLGGGSAPPAGQENK